ncbi:hypothetical protein R1sor_025302 [Riccia sorocarpa]|uniref:HMA domain-containing protein n=1 Tax=Riccia sorocarpa TaxID=122646 RepID=A0ABD3GC52_9MARC
MLYKRFTLIRLVLYSNANQKIKIGASASSQFRMISVNALFYGQEAPEPFWVVDTAASQTIICRPSTPPPSPSPFEEETPPPTDPPPPEFRELDFLAPICCEGCVERVIKHLLGLEGVETVRCQIESQIVSVKGYTPPELVMKAVQKEFKRGADLLPPPPVPEPTEEKPPQAEPPAVVVE